MAQNFDKNFLPDEIDYIVKHILLKGRELNELLMEELKYDKV